jgi:hypothetical protein
MGKTTRERVLITLLPAILAVCVYLLSFDRTKELTAANEALESARTAQVSEQAVFEERTRLDDLRKASEREKAEKAKLDQQRKELAEIRGARSAVRTDAMERLLNILWSRDLYPYQEGPVEGAQLETSSAFDEVMRGLQPPASRENAITPAGPPAAASSPPPDPAKRLFHVRFYGRYGDVFAALEQLRDADLPVIPVVIHMSQAQPETTWRSWMLVVWL